MRKLLIAIALLMFCASPVMAKNVYLDGEMNSRIDYEMKRRILSASSASQFLLSFVAPKTLHTPTFSQEISNFSLKFSPQPVDKSVVVDDRGNEVMTYTWNNPPQYIDVTVSFTAVNKSTLKKIQSSSAFPMNANVPADVAPYLAPSEYVQSADSRITALSARLVRGASTEFDAIRNIITHVVDNMRYVTPPQAYDALYSLDSGRGNCQNYSHLAAALMRAARIPTRIVNGMTLDQPYDINLKSGAFRSKMGLGRHSWIEAWFPDLGWVPFDPQNTVFFIPNRFIKVEVGIDNKETINDGLVQYTIASGSSTRPTVQDSYAPDFKSDQVRLNGQMADLGPRNMLMQPNAAPGIAVAELPPQPSYTPTPGPFKPTTPPTPAPTATPPVFKPTPSYTPTPAPTSTPPPLRPTPPPTLTPPRPPVAGKQPYYFGNMEFPQDIDFGQYNETSSKGGGVFAITRNFMVETAEYVTTKMVQYAQVFELDRHLELSYVSLALHRFGGDGQLWIEILADNNGVPGQSVFTSDIIDLERISMKPGYRWVDFAFNADQTRLKPGSYWIALGFTGEPIINWFYTYGKPVGPTYGTRFKGVFDKAWSGALSYEFNYRVVGMSESKPEPQPAPKQTPKTKKKV